MDSLDAVLDRAMQPGVLPRNYNAVLDADTSASRVDLLQFVDNGHLLKRLSLAMAESYHLPPSTVFLMGLGTFSAVSCGKWCVVYQDGKSRLPIGLDVIDEQPSGVGKTRCLITFLNPFYEIHKSIAEKRKQRISELLHIQASNDGVLDEDSEDELAELQSGKIPILLTTNATAEGLEKTLAGNKGFFAAISSEQGLFNSLFGRSYSNGVNNNDIVLNGFDGGFVNVARAGREGFSGHVVGAIVCFAQQGSVETILDVSQGTGLAERFLMLVEPHLLGQRDHTKATFINAELLAEYASRCEFADKVFSSPESYDELSCLFISPDGFRRIAEYKNIIEPHLADGGKYSHGSLRGVASKINMQIMKIAANLHLLDDGFYVYEIPERHVISAIKIADRLLQHQRKMLIDKGIIGLKAEYSAILSAFEKRTSLSEREIIHVKRYVKPFADTKNPSDAIRQTLSEMTLAGLLEAFVDGRKTLYRIGQ